MIIGRELMVQLGPPAEFKHQVLQWDGVTVPMKDPIGMIGKLDITSRYMCEVVMYRLQNQHLQENLLRD